MFQVQEIPAELEILSSANFNIQDYIIYGLIRGISIYKRKNVLFQNFKETLISLESVQKKSVFFCHETSVVVGVGHKIYYKLINEKSILINRRM